MWSMLARSPHTLNRQFDAGAFWRGKICVTLLADHAIVGCA